MKWVIQIPGDKLGGNETVLFNVIRNNPSFEWVLFSSKGPVLEYFSSVISDWCEIPRTAFQWKDLLKKENPAGVIFTYGNVLSGAAVCRSLGIPIVWRCGGPTILPVEDGLNYQRMLSEMSDLVIVPGREQANLFREHSPDKIVEIPNGINLEVFFEQRASTRLEIRKQLGVSHRSRLIGNTCRMAYLKRQWDLFDVLEREEAQQKDIHLLFISRSDHPESRGVWEKLWDRAMKKKLESRIHFVHASPDFVAPLLSAIDIFAFCSQSEGLSNAILEAMACSIPVVSYNSPGCKELLQGNDCGKLIPFGDTREMSRVLCELLGNEEEMARLGKKGRNTILANYTLGSMVQTYRHWLEKVGTHSVA